MNHNLRVICCQVAAADWRWVAPRIDPQEISWEFVTALAQSQGALLKSSWEAVRRLKRGGTDLLITHGPFLTLRCGVLRRLLRARVPQIAYSFHYDVDPSPAKRRLIAQMARGIDLFVVYSRAEIDHYHRMFGIPRERIRMTYWGIRPPEPLDDPTPIVAGDYFCTIGGSARDYKTFLKAAAQVPDIPIAAVVRPDSLAGLEVPPNVQVFVNLPYDRMANVLVNSRGVVIPLTEAARSGHSVLVLALHHGKAVVMSDVPGVRDYLRDGETALASPPSDPEGLAAAMRRLWEDRELARKLGDEGLRFARTHCTEEAIVGDLRSSLRQLELI